MSRRKSKTGLSQTGITPEGKRVMNGVYKYYETHGLPLDVLFTVFIRKDWIPDWISFYQEARAAGMEHSRILSKLEEAISDSFGKEWSDLVILKLNQIFGSQEKQ